jgi:uncharacterized protein (TIGR02246 family)
MLRSFLLLTALFLGSSVLVRAQTTVSTKSPGSVENEIEQVVASQREAALKNDIVMMTDILADDYISTNADGDVRNKQQTVDFYKKGDLQYEALEISDIYIRVLGPSSAVAVFKVTTRERYKGQDRSGQFRVTRVYAKRSGKWQVVVNHSTSLTM